MLNKKIIKMKLFLFVATSSKKFPQIWLSVCPWVKHISLNCSTKRRLQYLALNNLNIWPDMYFVVSPRSYRILAKWLRKLTMIYSTIFGGFWGPFNAPVTHISYKRCSHIQKLLLKPGGQRTLSSIWSKCHKFWSKTTPTDYMVEKTYHLAWYFGPFGAYLMPQGPI